MNAAITERAMPFKKSIISFPNKKVSGALFVNININQNIIDIKNIIVSSLFSFMKDIVLKYIIVYNIGSSPVIG